MTHKPFEDGVPQRPSVTSSRHEGTAEVAVDPRHPSDEFLQREIDDNRRAEFWLIPKTVLALVVVAVLIVIREVFFS